MWRRVAVVGQRPPSAVGVSRRQAHGCPTQDVSRCGAVRPKRGGRVALAANSERLHIMCERDVGLFSLFQQVVANVPWALAEGRVPIVHFGRRTCYWTPTGYRDRDTVWEYYFDPLVSTHPAASVPDDVRVAMSAEAPSAFEVGYQSAASCFVTSHFGDHRDLNGVTLSIPYEWDDPSDSVRRDAKSVLDRFVRPRSYIRFKADRFAARQLRTHIHDVPLAINPNRCASPTRQPRTNAASIRNDLIQLGGARGPCDRQICRTPGQRPPPARGAHGSASTYRRHRSWRRATGAAESTAFSPTTCSANNAATCGAQRPRQENTSGRPLGCLVRDWDGSF